MIPLDEANLRCCALRYVSRTGQLAANKTGWPVKYVLVDHADMPSELGAAIERQPRLNLVVTVGDVDVYAIVAGK